MEMPQNTKNRIIISSKPSSGYLSEEYENTNSQRYMRPMSTAALLTIAKAWEQLNHPSIAEYVYTQRDIAQPQER